MNISIYIYKSIFTLYIYVDEKQIANIHTARDFIAATIHEEQLIIVGGNDDKGKHTDSVEQYDAVADRWKNLPLLARSTGGGILVSFL